MAQVVRVGQGWDIHRLAAGRKLMVGGVQVDAPAGAAGHSDADVALHAVIDAMLGAAGLGDIGEEFRDTEAAYKDIDSGVLLGRARELAARAGYGVVNVDVTVILESPKLGPYKERMRRRVAELLGLGVEAVNIKAKTNEGLGEIGAGRAIACQAVVALGVLGGEAKAS